MLVSRSEYRDYSDAPGESSFGTLIMVYPGFRPVYYPKIFVNGLGFTSP